MPRWVSWVNISIIRRIIDKYNLQDSPIEPLEDWLLRKIIQPTTSVDELLRTPVIKASGTIDPGAIGNETLFTVPAGKRWYLHADHIFRNGGANLETSRIQVGDGSSTMTIDTYSSSSSHAEYFGHVCKLEPGWTVSCYVSAYAAGDTLECYLLVDEEDAY